MGGLEHVVLVITHPQVTVFTNYRIQVHVVRVDVAGAQRAPLCKLVVVFVLCGNKRAPFLISGLIALFVVADTMQTSKRQVERTVVLYISYARLRNMGAFAVFSLVFVDDFLLGNAELFTSMVLVCFLPSVKLTCHFIIDIGADNSNTGSSAISRTLVILVC